jgi:hypothetical protein
MQLRLGMAGLRLLYQGKLCGSPLKDSALRPGFPGYWITGTYDTANRMLELQSETAPVQVTDVLVGVS